MQLIFQPFMEVFTEEQNIHKEICSQLVCVISIPC